MVKSFKLFNILLSSAFLLLLYSDNLIAQVLEGEYTNLVDRKGTVKAEYKIIDEDTVFDGTFHFVIKQDLKDGHRFIKETYIGQYKNGFKTGKWEYDQLDLSYSVQDIENEEIRMIYWGKKEITDAKYVKGVPEGLWSYAFYHIDSAGDQSVEKVGSLRFQNGKPFGDFAFKSLKSPRYELDGKFDSLGRLDGYWELHYFTDSIEIQETRNYNDGFLLTLIRKNKKTGEIMDSLVYEEVINKLSTGIVSKASENFDVLFDDGFLLESPYLKQQKSGNELLKVAYKAFLWADLGRGALEGSRHDFNPGTGRFEYDLPKSFLKNLNEMREDLNGIIERSDEMLDDPKFYINFHLSELLSKSEAILRYEKEKAQGILELVNSRADSLYEHIDREVYFSNIYNKYIDQVDTIYYEYDGETRSILLDERTDKDLSPFYKLEDAISILNDRSEKAMVDIRSEFEKILQQQRLTALEQDIQFSSRKIENSYTEKGQGLSNEIYQNSIKPWTSNIMQQYASINEMDKREMEGRFILGVLEDLKELKSRIDSIEYMESEIDSAYTEYVFDPYTYSQNIKKRLKKRLYDAAAISYYNHLKSELINENHAEEISKHVEEIETLQQRLMELARENTRSLEKKLKKTTDHKDIKKLLELEE
ncbi:hypothetical protein HZR84_06095 [Hyphobacterium sp. CCMP332]|nr:hypothetical protein HZR84_06095 [Hyphobacterium sp. CCMP332]